MDKMNEMHDKFLVLAEKLWVTPDLIEKIKEWFEKWDSEVKVTTVEVEKEPEDTSTKDEVVASKPIDIAKPIEPKMPSEEDLSKMKPEELLMFTKMLLRKWLEKENNSDTPFMVMMKKHWY